MKTKTDFYYNIQVYKFILHTSGDDIIQQKIRGLP